MKVRALIIVLCIGWHFVSAQQFAFDRRVLADDVLLYEDLGRPGAFYYVPDTLVIAVDAQGNPQINLTKFISNKANSDGSRQNKYQAGGVVQLMLDFSIPAERLLRAKQKLRETRPNAEILGAVPVNVIGQPISQWLLKDEFRDKGYYELSCEFYPPAGELVALQVPREEATILSKSGWIFFTVFNMGCQIPFNNCSIEIPRDSLKAAGSKNEASIADWLQKGVVRVFTPANKPMQLAKREMEALSAYFLKALSTMPAAIQANAPTLDLSLARADVRCEGDKCRIFLKGDSCLFAFQGLANRVPQDKNNVSSSAVVTDVETAQRELFFMLDNSNLKDLDQLKDYEIDLLLMAGTLANRSVFLLDSLESNFQSSQNVPAIVRLPRYKSLDEHGNYNLGYSYFIHQRVQSDRYSQPIENAQWYSSISPANIISLPFEKWNVQVECDREDMKKKGFQGVRIEFFDAVKKEKQAVTAPVKPVSAVADTGQANPVLARFKEVLTILEAENDANDPAKLYEKGQYLGDLILTSNAAEPFVERSLLKPKKGDNNGLFYKISKVRKPTETGGADAGSLLEEPLRYSTQTYFFIEF